jgi:hypothetical protein
VTLGCSKPSAAPSEGAASAAPAPSAAPAQSAAPEPPKPSTWSGEYNAEHASMYVPDGAEWSGVKFHGDDASTNLGAGTLKVSIDPTGRVSGEGEGALGPFEVSGLLDGNTFSARLSPQHPADGFTGVATGARTGEAIAGTMRLSYSNASIVREARFTLGKK